MCVREVRLSVYLMGEWIGLIGFVLFRKKIRKGQKKLPNGVAVEAQRVRES